MAAYKSVVSKAECLERLAFYKGLEKQCIDLGSEKAAAVYARAFFYLRRCLVREGIIKHDE